MPPTPPPERDPDSIESHRTPRWVRISVIVVLVLAAVLVVLLLAGGDHGPGRHAAAGVHAATA